MERPIKEDREAVNDVKERLEAMKRTRSALLGQLTKLQRKLEVILQDPSKYELALHLKTIFDEALKKCFDHSSAYFEAIPNDDMHENMKLEAELKCESLKNKRYEYGERFAMFVEECTDQEGSASQGSSRKFFKSRKSFSLTSKQRELFELECTKFSVESRKLLAETKA